MNLIQYADATVHDYNDGAVHVTEFNFSSNDKMNDAEITISGRYPSKGYAVNDISHAIVSVESGSARFTIKDKQAQELRVGDRVFIDTGEPYCFEATDELAIRYVASPAWSAKQSRIID